MHQIEQEETGMQTLMSDIEAMAYAEGETHGQLNLLLRLLSRRFGPLPAEFEVRITALAPEARLALGEALFDLTSLQALEAWFVAKNQA
jgi:hypothetical protein